MVCMNIQRSVNKLNQRGVIDLPILKNKTPGSFVMIGKDILRIQI